MLMVKFHARILLSCCMRDLHIRCKIDKDPPKVNEGKVKRMFRKIKQVNLFKEKLKEKLYPTGASQVNFTVQQSLIKFQFTTV